MSRIKNRLSAAIGAAIVAGGMLASNAASAAIIADFNKVTAAAAGWSVVYQGGYGTPFDYAAVLNSIAPGSNVALASSASTTAPDYDLFADTTLSILQTITGLNQTNFDNGAYWYRNGSSTGFAPVALITQCSADATGTGVCGPAEDPLLSDLRLSWHGGDPIAGGGWRSGLNIWLNSDNNWQRYVLVQQVPEPGALALFALGLAGLAATRRKSKAS